MPPILVNDLGFLNRYAPCTVHWCGTFEQNALTSVIGVGYKQICPLHGLLIMFSDLCELLTAVRKAKTDQTNSFFSRDVNAKIGG